MVQLQYSGMLERFKDVPDPRTQPNRIYPWPFLWDLIGAAMASACQTPAAIARFIKEHHDELLAALPPSLVRLPCESTIRRTLACVDSVISAVRYLFCWLDVICVGSSSLWMRCIRSSRPRA